MYWTRPKMSRDKPPCNCIFGLLKKFRSLAAQRAASVQCSVVWPFRRRVENEVDDPRRLSRSLCIGLVGEQRSSGFPCIQLHLYMSARFGSAPPLTPPPPFPLFSLLQATLISLKGHYGVWATAAES